MMRPSVSATTNMEQTSAVGKRLQKQLDQRGIAPHDCAGVERLAATNPTSCAIPFRLQ